jgi:lichenan operon transcriptional antiterminator
MVQPLSKRQRDILIILMKARQPTTSEWIAKELGNSDRTVRTELKKIQNDSISMGFKVNSLRGKGYQIQVMDEEKYETIQKFILSNYDEISDDFAVQENRVLFMLQRLLLDKGFIKLESFTEEMFVSLSTVQNDLKLVKEILKKYQLELINRPHYGSKVEGDEYMKRLCLSNSILKQSNENLSITDDSMELIDYFLLERIKEILIRKVRNFKIDISDISLDNLATHIAIACKRIEKGFYIEHLNQFINEHYPFESIVADEIISQVEHFTGLKFPHGEKDYIIVHLLGTKLLNPNELYQFSDFDEAGAIIQCMLERLRHELNWDFRNDLELIQALTLHIRPAMNRLRYKMNIYNPLLKDIKTKHPVAFEGAVIASKCIEEYLQTEIVEDEIAYIALHIGVALERLKLKKRNIKRVIIVCATGIGSAKLLYYRLKNLFNQEMEVVDTINYYNLSSYDLGSIDMIISTIPIKEDIGVKVQIVNTFLEERDIEQIRNKLLNENLELGKYMHASRIFLQKEFTSKQDILSFLSKELIKQHLVPDHYLDLVLERENAAPTSFGNLVAIPHPITPVTEDTFWTICTLKRPIQWNEQQMVQFIFLLNIKKGSKGDLDKMYQRLIGIIENISLIKRLVECKSPQDLIKELNI